MRTGLKVLLVLIVLGVLAAGLLPPLLDQGGVRDAARNSAVAGAAVVLNSRVGLSNASVNVAVQRSLAGHHDLKLVSVKVSGVVVTVVVTKEVHTFMSGTPGLEHWFRLTVTESASAYGGVQ